MDPLLIHRLFEANAEIYDRVNNIISFGLVNKWRRRAAAEAAFRRDARILDLFAGTGALGIEAASLLGPDGRLVFVDFSPKMLDIARRKATERKFSCHTEFIVQNIQSENLFRNTGTYDAITIGFGLRYVDEPAPLIKRLRNLLKPNGRLVILECAAPSGNRLTPAALYFFHILPRLASFLGARQDIQDHLCSTAREFSVPRLRAGLESADLTIIKEKRFASGTVQCLTAKKIAPRRVYS